MPAVLFLGLCWFWSIDGPHPAIVLRWLWSGNLNPAWNAQGSEQIFYSEYKKNMFISQVDQPMQFPVSHAFTLRFVFFVVRSSCRSGVWLRWPLLGCKTSIPCWWGFQTSECRMRPSSRIICSLGDQSSVSFFFVFKLVVARLSWPIRQSLGCWFR